MTSIIRDTRLDAPCAEVWDILMRPKTLQYVAFPLLVFRPVDPAAFAEEWADGDHLVRMRFLGIIPIGKQVIAITRAPADESGERRLRDNGHSALVKRWDHWIILTPDGDGTLYRDDVTIEAGLLTPFVALFARVFYWHRQRRWHRLLANRAPVGGVRAR